MKTNAPEDGQSERTVWYCENCRIRGRVLVGESIEHMAEIGRSEKVEFVPSCHHSVMVVVLRPAEDSVVLTYTEVPK